MPLVQVPKNIQPRQIEFGDDVERSKPGALYFVPGTNKRITEEELKWIKENHKRFFGLLVIVQAKDKPSRLALERAAKSKKETAKKRPKDKPSKSKQRAAALLKKKEKGEGKPAPSAPPPSPNVEPASVTEGSGKKGGKKNK